MRRLLLAAIVGYQRYLSPHKGFHCAYRVHTGRQSCSALGYRAVRRYGVLAGLAILRRRTYLCGVAHRRHSPPPNPAFHGQRGFCDCACDLPCELPSADFCGSALDCASYCGGCDWPSRDRKTDDKEQSVHIPPNTKALHPQGEVHDA
ncbi:MAG: membrane protein insertion efficiency factor YidD [Actinomycetota bacterium]